MSDPQKEVVQKKDEQVFDLTPVLTPISIFLSALVISGTIFFSMRGANFGVLGTGTTAAASSSAATSSAAAQVVSVSEVDFGSAPMLGNKASNVYMVEYTDFQCPYCERHYTTTYPDIKKNYIDTNQIAYFSKDFPLSFHENAQKAAEAGQCALDQGKYWEMHDKMFSNQANITVPDLKKYASDLGLDAAKFADCLDNSKDAQRVKDSETNGGTAGVNGTPGFFVGTKVSDTKVKGFLIPGAFPYSNFDTVLKDIQNVGIDQAAANFQKVLNGA
ncbi:MAG: DsbA family protein [bacterium]